MTGRERLIRAAGGEHVDRRAVIAWPFYSEESDAVVSSARLPRLTRPDTEGKLVLAEVRNPFGLALARGVDLNRALSEDPEKGSRLLDELTAEVSDAMHTSLAAEADGILYLLHGAREAHCTPMQYGGYYLERDRDLLESVASAKLNILFVVGDADLYIDFVSDLPAHVFAWDSAASGVASSQVRQLRQGAQASAEEDSEIYLETSSVRVSQHMEKNEFAAV